MTKYTGPIEEVEIVEKVKLTEFQAKEFESFKTLRSSLEEWARDKQDPNAVHSIIHELSFDEMARAYLIGYEIEPEQPKFQPGDRVVRLDGQCFSGFKNIEVVERVKEHSITLSNSLQYSYDFVRHATPEEIYWMETLGREKVGDFRKGDVIKCDDKFLQVFENMGCDIYGSHISPEFAGKLYSGGSLYAMSPVESFNPFPKEPE